MALKEVCRSACIAWGPPTRGPAHTKCAASQEEKSTSSGSSLQSHQLYLALGTMGLDPHLELATVDFASSSTALPVVASVSASSPFQCIAWGSSGQNKLAGVAGEHGNGVGVGERALGLLAGGMADGDVTLWDAEAILRSGSPSGSELSSFGSANGTGEASGSAKGLLASVPVHRNQRVHCIHFNPSRPSLLAAGGSSGSVSILDVENVYDVAVYEPGGEGQGSNSGASGDECTSLAWNRVVPHVLATAFSSGTTSVWDLKQRKTAVSFCDPTHRQSRPSSVVWLPNQATQLLLAYDDDRHPVLQLWDLRNSSYPLRETASDGVYGHTRGIVNAALNPMDSRMLLTSGRDNRIVCWWLEEDAFHTQGGQSHPSSGFSVYMQQQTQEPYVQLQWAPSSTPGVFAAAAPIRVCIKGLGSGGVSTGDSGLPGQQQQGLAGGAAEGGWMMGPAHDKYIPSWFRRPRGVHVGFGEDIAFFGPDSTSVVCAALGVPPPVVASATGSAEAEASLREEERELLGQHGEWREEEKELQQEALKLDDHLQRGDWHQACEEELRRLRDKSDVAETEQKMPEKVWNLLMRLFQQPRSSALVEAFTLPESEVVKRVEAFLGRPLPLKKKETESQQMQSSVAAYPQPGPMSPAAAPTYGHPGVAPPGSYLRPSAYPQQQPMSSGSPIYGGNQVGPGGMQAALPAVGANVGSVAQGNGFYGAPQVNGVEPQQAFRQEEVDPEKFFLQLSSGPENEKRPCAGEGRESSAGREGEEDGRLSSQQGGEAERAKSAEEVESEKAGQKLCTSRLGSSQSGPVDWSSEVGSLVRACLLCGCLEGAIELLQSYGSEADALLLAAAAAGAGSSATQGSRASFAAVAGANGASLWRSACRAYIEKIADPFMKLVGYVILEDFPALIAAVPVSAPHSSEPWRDALALLCCYVTDGTQLASLCRQLGDRLSANGSDVFGALFCYFCAGDFSGACRIWRQDLQRCLSGKAGAFEHAEKPTRSRSVWLGRHLLATMKRMLILRAALRYGEPCVEFEEVAVTYASYLSSDPALFVPAMRLLVSTCGVGAMAAGARGVQGELKGHPGAAGASDVRAAAATLAFRLFHAQAEQMQRFGFFPPPSPFEGKLAPGAPGLKQPARASGAAAPEPQVGLHGDPSLSQRQAQPPMTGGQRGSVASVGSAVDNRFPSFPPKGTGPQAPPPIHPGVQPPSADQHRIANPVGMGPSPPAAPFHQMNGYGGVSPPAAEGGPVHPPSSAFGATGQPAVRPPLASKPPPVSSPFYQGAPSTTSQPSAGPMPPAASQPPQGPYPPGHPSNAGVAPPRPTSQGPMPPSHGVSPLGGPAPPAGGLSHVHPGSSPSPPPPQMTLPQASHGTFPPSGLQQGRVPQGPPGPFEGSGNPQGGFGSLTGAQQPPLPPPSMGSAGGVPTLQQQQAEEQPIPAYSAPTVGAQPIKPGMPVPWPIPTSAQLNSRTTKSTYAANVNIHKATEKPDGAGALSPPMPPEKQAYVQRVISQLLQFQTGAAANDLNQKMEELFNKMRSGELSSSASQRLVQLCELVEQQQHIQAQKVHAELSSTEWGTSNKGWLMGLKRLLPKP
ncbi:WD domain, G-beta repeat-containing protein [Toxoplasma gondii GT1]|uniref:WD domain, G-beta repeat-containing protein n=4 Tax=Toxoplasma gondii TaxID=5811 RepID=S7UT11_TOXGG|nr:WD domain, G-beta repeat-containing protein [Toxoplasma gondii GT1]KAF4639316.1 WD domain, G-beta repeat-containing protein [Toxoplasma gondii]